MKRLATALLLSVLIPGAASLIPGAASAERRVALTIDDLPAAGPRTRSVADNVARLVKAVRASGVPVVGFITAGRGHLAAMRPWVEARLPLANHTFSHRPYSRLGIKAYLADIRKNEVAVREALGVELRGTYFRYPFLDHGQSKQKVDAVARYLAKGRYRLAPVSLDTIDYRFTHFYGKSTSPEARRAVAALYLRHIGEAARHFEGLSRRLYKREIPLILLVHANELNADRLGGVIGVLRRRGYRFVTLARALQDRAYLEYGLRTPVIRMRGDRNFLNQVAVSRGLRIPDPTGSAHFDRVWLPKIRKISGRQTR
jgi:peptidoglycan/xylan/chitin deacetylase (PgdA/CDA1 family)